MLQNGVSPDKFTFPFVLRACAHGHAIAEGEQLHCQLVKSPLQVDMFVQGALIVFYAKCGEIEAAQQLFDSMPHRNSFCWNVMIDGYVKNDDVGAAHRLFDSMPHRDLFSWNTMIDGHVRCGEIEVARQLFDEMPERDVVSWNSMIYCYAKYGDMKAAGELFDRMEVRDVVTWTVMVNGLARWSEVEIAHCLFEKIPQKSLVSWNSLIDGYAKRGNMKAALLLFQLMEGRNLTSWNVMLDAYSKCGEMRIARELFEQMDVRDIFSWNIMIDGYARVGCLEVAQEFFHTMPSKDLVSWNTLIAACKQNSRPKEAIRLFHMMQMAGEKPDDFTLSTALSAIADLGSFVQGRWIHTYVVRNKFFLDGIVGVSLIDMYSKCGYVDIAWGIFESVLHKTIDHWNSMISGLALHGYGNRATCLFEEMLKLMIEPDDISFIGVLSACSHAGLVHQGRQYFELMSLKYGIAPKIQHYGCMVDLLGRAGHLEEAYALVMDMPVQPNDVVWRALLGAARNRGNIEIGEHAANNLIELEPHDTSSYVLLSNIYGATQRWECALQIRKKMKERCPLKTPGYSSIELNGVVHEFIVGGTSHPQIIEIHLLLNEMTTGLMLAGYTPITRHSLFDIDV
eukprot:TRINITY_DN34268_c0_g4_i1.p1 TRINITY_DN34268_c0_g4~~TRINITY_DN34268_c0_g4_i1.p1  ORF type:complete len:623 (-),score=96.38 TRINITY_DN34268_c0_g4_i1:966-2834(-)